MYVRREIQPSIIWYFSWRTVLFSAALSTMVYALHQWFGWHDIAIPFLPIATIGTAVAFYVGFKNNSAYDRLWEARKIWGEIVNLSRAAASYLLAVVPANEREKANDRVKAFIYRQIAYVNLLRIQLRRRNVWDNTHIYTQLASRCFPSKPFEEELESTLRTLCSAEADALIHKKNVAKELIYQQMSALTVLKRDQLIDGYEHSDLMRLCTEMYTQQGKAERLKSFPFPRQYAYFSEVFVGLFLLLLPFGLIGEFAKIDEHRTWLAIPFSIMLSWIFDTMEKVGDTSENPFENSLNDIPMSAICRTIEIDLRELLGETELPEPLQPVDNFLM
jgi:ion channel-forming bestrophin family protein